MSRPVEAALTQIITTYALMAPEASPECVRAELTPYPKGLYAAGSATWRRSRSPAWRACAPSTNQPEGPSRRLRISRGIAVGIEAVAQPSQVAVG